MHQVTLSHEASSRRSQDAQSNSGPASNRETSFTRDAPPCIRIVSLTSTATVTNGDALISDAAHDACSVKSFAPTNKAALISCSETHVLCAHSCREPR